MRLNKKAWLLSLLVGIFILTSLVRLEAWALKNYQAKYARYKIEKRSSISRYESIKIVGQTMDYILGQSPKETISNYYGEIELVHLDDLREIFLGLAWLRNLTGAGAILLYLAMDRQERRLLPKYLAYGLFFLLGLSMVFLLNFKQAFYLFHRLAFRNDSWYLDKTTSILIQFMPEEMFFHMLVQVLLAYTLIMIIFQAIIYFKDRK